MFEAIIASVIASLIGVAIMIAYDQYKIRKGN